MDAATTAAEHVSRARTEIETVRRLIVQGSQVGIAADNALISLALAEAELVAAGATKQFAESVSSSLSAEEVEARFQAQVLQPGEIERPRKRCPDLPVEQPGVHADAPEGLSFASGDIAFKWDLPDPED